MKSLNVGCLIAFGVLSLLLVACDFSTSEEIAEKEASVSCPKALACPDTLEPGTICDARDGKIYRTVKIGAQTWMAENIRYKTASSICYGNTSSDCAKYGRYYTFGDAYNVCPSGWHLPSAKEFAVLLKSIGGESKAGGKLKSQNDWNVNNNKCNGTDDYGFAALPTGMMMNEYESFGKGRESYFWSETDERPNSIYVLKIHCDTESATVGWTVEPDYGIPVRCIKD